MSECDCDYWHSKHRWHCATNYPAPEPADQTRADVEALLTTILAAAPGTPTLTCRKIAEAVADRLAAEQAEHAAEVAKCSCCGETPVINPRPHDDIVVCEPCMHVMWNAEAAEFRSRAEAAGATVAIAADVVADFGTVCCDNPNQCGCSMDRLRAALDGGR